MLRSVFVNTIFLVCLLAGSICAFAQSGSIREVRIEKKSSTVFTVRFRLEAGQVIGNAPLQLLIERRRAGAVETVFSDAFSAVRGADGWYRYTWNTDAQTVKPGDDLRATIRITREQPVVRTQPRAPGGNRRPTANAGSFRDVELPLVQPLVLDAGASSDPEGKTLRYTWRQIAGPGQAQLQGADSARARVSGALREGTYAFELIVRDPAGASDTDRLVITVRPAPTTPVATPPSATTAPAPRIDTITRPVLVTAQAKARPRLKGGPSNALVNLLVPGLGHYYVSGDYTGQGRKGTAFIVTGLYAASAGAAVYFKLRSDDQYRKYLAAANQLEYQHDASGAVIGVRGPGTEANSYLRSAQSSHRNFLIAAGTGLAVSGADFIYTLIRGAKNRSEWKQAYRTSFYLVPQTNGWSAGIRLHF